LALILPLLFACVSSSIPVEPKDQNDDAGARIMPSNDSNDESDNGSDVDSNPSVDACHQTVWFNTTSDGERRYERIVFSFEYNNEGWYQDYDAWEDVASASIGFKSVPESSAFRWSFQFDPDSDPTNKNELYSCIGTAQWGTNSAVYDDSDQPIAVSDKEPNVEDGCELTTIVSCNN